MFKKAINLNIPIASTTLAGQVAHAPTGDPGFHMFLNKLQSRHGEVGQRVADKYRAMAPAMHQHGMLTGNPHGTYNALATQATREIVNSRNEAFRSRIPAQIARHMNSAALAHEAVQPGAYNARMSHPRAAAFGDFMRSGKGTAVKSVAALAAGAGAAMYLKHKLTQPKSKEEGEGDDG